MRGRGLSDVLISPLFKAAEEGKVALVRELLLKGAAPNAGLCTWNDGIVSYEAL